MTDGVTLVNGQDAKDGSVQIGKLTETPDVPIVEYQYQPLHEEKDPDITVVLSDQDMNEAELRVRQLTDIQRSITDNGVNYETVVALESICPGIIFNNFPETGFSNDPSQRSLSITMERIDGAKLGGIAAVIALIIAGIIALFKKFTGNDKDVIGRIKSEDDLKQLKQHAEKVVPDIQTKAKLTEETIRRNTEAKKWLIDHKLIDIIQMHGRLSPTLNVEAAVTDIGSYLKQVGYGDPKRNVLFNIDNSMGSSLPNIFYKPNLERDFEAYAAFLESFPQVVRKRSDSLNAFSRTFNEVKYDKPITFERQEDLLINAIAKFTGARGYNSEQEAVEDLRRKIREDWSITDRGTEITMFQLANILSEKCTKPLRKIIRSHSELEKEFTKIEKFRERDLVLVMRSLDTAKRELNTLLNAVYVPLEKKPQYREALEKLEKAPAMLQEEFKLMARLAGTSMEAVIGASNSVKVMDRRISLYYSVIDALSSLLGRFEKQFGNDVT